MKSDYALQQDVERLPELLDEDIEVGVTDGIVTLTGAVRSDATRWNTEDAIKRLEGVKGLQDKTMVTPQQDPRPDGDIAKPWFP